MLFEKVKMQTDCIKNKMYSLLMYKQGVKMNCVCVRYI